MDMRTKLQFTDIEPTSQEAFTAPSRSVQWGVTLDNAGRTGQFGANGFGRGQSSQLRPPEYQEEEARDYLDARSLMGEGFGARPAPAARPAENEQQSARQILYGERERYAERGPDYEATFTGRSAVSFAPTSEYYDAAYSTAYQPQQTAAPVREPDRHSAEGIGPSRRTMEHYSESDRERMVEMFEQKISNAAFLDIQEAEQKETKPKTSLSLKTKGMIAVYAAIVILLAVLIAATGSLIARAGKQIISLETDLAAVTATVGTKLSDLSELTEESNISERAKSLGMVEAGDTETLILIPPQGAAVYEEVTNWFDRFCDWLAWAA